MAESKMEDVLPGKMEVSEQDQFTVEKVDTALLPGLPAEGETLEVIGFETLPSGTFLRVTYPGNVESEYRKKRGWEMSPTSLWEAVDGGVLSQKAIE